MKTSRWSLLSEADKQRMSTLSCSFFADNLHVIDMPYRLSSWALNDPGNTSLWFDENDNLVAWAVMQTPFWTIDYAYHPHSGLHTEVLQWANERARAILNTEYGHPAWFVMVFAGQTDRRQHLEEAGFRCQADAGEDSWSKVLMRRPADLPVNDHEVPSGFIFRSLAGEREVRDYVELHRAVFESKNMTEAWRVRTLRHPNYVPELDVVAEAPEGRLVAFCVCWLNKDASPIPVGQVEPLGSHPDFRHQGLGRAVLSEGLRRLQSLGARDIYVETDSYRNSAFQLYESCGFQVVQDVLVYRKDY